MNVLDDLFFKYHADKTPRIKHHYSHVYYELFKDRRESVKKVLEIGTAEGASLFAWREFFPNATIYGAEIDPKRVALLQGQERIKVFQCDQSNATDLLRVIEEIGPDIDLIVDDGSHKPWDQVFSIFKLMQKVDKKTTYIIEDVNEPRIIKELNFDRWDCQMLRVGKRHDDRLIIVEHK